MLSGGSHADYNYAGLKGGSHADYDMAAIKGGSHADYDMAAIKGGSHADYNYAGLKGGSHSDYDMAAIKGGKVAKGSAAAKARMAYLRSLRGKGRDSGFVSKKRKSDDDYSDDDIGGDEPEDATTTDSMPLPEIFSSPSPEESYRVGKEFGARISAILELAQQRANELGLTPEKISELAAKAAKEGSTSTEGKGVIQGIFDRGIGAKNLTTKQKKALFDTYLDLDGKGLI